VATNALEIIGPNAEPSRWRIHLTSREGAPDEISVNGIVSDQQAAARLIAALEIIGSFLREDEPNGD
jgi:hypothetical protein